MGKKKRKKIKFSYSNQWEQTFCKEFEKESDRACVILSAAMLDQALETLLKAYLVSTSSKEDDFLEGIYAPISSFSAKIDLSFRIGLISAKFCRDLHLIRKIRNEFAHSITNCDFQNESIHRRVLELRRSSTFIDRHPTTRKSFVSGVKGDFEMTVSWMLFYLGKLIEVTESLDAAEEEFGYTTEFFERKKGKKLTKRRK